jgi:hypothetical protein
MFNSGLLQQMIVRGEGALVSLHLHTLGFIRKYLLTVADKVCTALDKAVQIGTHTHTHTHTHTYTHTSHIHANKQYCNVTLYLTKTQNIVSNSLHEDEYKYEYECKDK